MGNPNRRVRVVGGGSSEFGSRRRVLKESKGEAEVAAFCSAHDWPRAREGWLDPDTKWEYKITWSCGPAVQLHYVEDGLAGCRYVQTSSTNSALLATYVEMADEELSFWSRGELLRDVDDSADPLSKGRGLIRMGVGAPIGEDPEVITRIQCGLRNSAREVRDMSILAAFYAKYPQLRTTLREVAEEDQDGELRLRARAILEAYDTLGVRQP
ncbi:hypothetical protein AB8O64_01470 [Streptomyces sp. QH1-20]|uniref:hypothetical protein n=1 Tax=Streptomyces sp. QH1-20 TaxID=3240934 RepID=UPI003517758C